MNDIYPLWVAARGIMIIAPVNWYQAGQHDGLKLAAAVKGRWPPIKIVATSGLVHVRPDDLPQGGRFLPKPYNPTQLTATLRELTVDP